MKTSELIAEILVIGVGAALWIILLLISLFDGLSSTVTELSYLSLVPVMAIIYVFGIMTDRVGDIFFGRFLPSKYSNWSPSKVASWKNARDQMIEQNEYVQILYMSSQSRKKIMRGWAINFLGLAFALTVGILLESAFILEMFSNFWPAVVSLLMSFLCWLLWQSMDSAQFDVFERLFENSSSESP